MPAAVFDSDPLLRRLERAALAFCVTAAGSALAVRRGNPDVALGVLGGGLLTAVSYWAIRSSVTGLVTLLTASAAARARSADEAPVAAGAPDGPGVAPEDRPSPGVLLLRLAGRYALLGLMVYAMIARFGLHPVGLLIGISSLFAAASFEALRAALGGGRPR